MKKFKDDGLVPEEFRQFRTHCRRLWGGLQGFLGQIRIITLPRRETISAMTAPSPVTGGVQAPPSSSSMKSMDTSRAARTSRSEQ